MTRSLLQQPRLTANPVPGVAPGVAGEDNTGTYIGAALGSATGVLILIGLVFCLVRRRGAGTCLCGIVSTQRYVIFCQCCKFTVPTMVMVDAADAPYVQKGMAACIHRNGGNRWPQAVMAACMPRRLHWSGL